MSVVARSVNPELISCERAGLGAVDPLVELHALAHQTPWRREQFEAVLSSPRQVALLLIGRQRLAAVKEQLLAACVLQLVAGEVEIHDLTVRPERRRLGLGRRLLAIALSWAGRQGATVAWLEVRAGNQAAQRLYARQGFQVVGQRADYYALPREDAVLMRWLLAADETLKSAQGAC